MQWGENRSSVYNSNEGKSPTRKPTAGSGSLELAGCPIHRLPTRQDALRQVAGCPVERCQQLLESVSDLLHGIALEEGLRPPLSPGSQRGLRLLPGSVRGGLDALA